MTKIDFIIVALTIIGLFVVAVKIMSDRIGGRMEEHKNFYTFFSLMLVLIVAAGIAVFVECLYYAEIKLWRFGLNSFSVFSIYLGASIVIGLIKRKVDEWKESRSSRKSIKDTEKRIRETSGVMRSNNVCRDVGKNAYRRANECVSIQGGYVQRDNSCVRMDNMAVRNDSCCKVSSASSNIINFGRRKRK